MAQIDETLRRLQFGNNLPAWLPARLAWWLAKRLPARWPQALDAWHEAMSCDQHVNRKGAGGRRFLLKVRSFPKPTREASDR